MFSDFLFLHVAECPNCLAKAIILLIAALLLGLLLGWVLWGHYLSRMRKAEHERDEYHVKFTNLEKDFASLKYSHDELTREAGTFRSQIGKLEADKAVLEAQLHRMKEHVEQLEAGGAKAKAKPAAKGLVVGKGAGKGDDLKKIEGIGPKIEKLLKEADIRTFDDLVKAPLDKVRKVLEAAGPNFNMALPDTWGKQAKLAAAGKWDELKEYQEKLKGGRE